MSSGPPAIPGDGEVPQEPQRRPPTVIELETKKRLLGGGGGRNLISISAEGIIVEHATRLRAPLRIPPGIIGAVALDPGPPKGDGPIGRFPILKRVATGRVVPRQEGIEGWLWTSAGGSAFTTIGEEDTAPNMAIVFLTPIQGEPLEESLEPKFLEDVAKRTPLGEPALFGVLVRLAQVEPARAACTRLGLIHDLTDREIAPVHRRHLPTDKPADPRISAADQIRARTSVPPPGMG